MATRQCSVRSLFYLELPWSNHAAGLACAVYLSWLLCVCRSLLLKLGSGHPIVKGCTGLPCLHATAGKG